MCVCACARARVFVIGLCLSRRPSVTLCTDKRTHASRRGLWEGGVALRGCARLLSFPFFPPSRPSSAQVLQPSPLLTYRLQVFFLFILRHIFPSVSVPYNLCPPPPLALRSFLRYGLPSVNVAIVVGCHAALRSPPFWFIGHNRRNFFKGYEGLDSAPTIFLFPLSLSIFSGIELLWLVASGQRGEPSVALCTEQVSGSSLAGGRPGPLGSLLPQRIVQGRGVLQCSVPV